MIIIDDLIQTGGTLKECGRVRTIPVKSLIWPRCEKTVLWGIPTKSDINRTVQPQKMARGLKFRM